MSCPASRIMRFAPQQIDCQFKGKSNVVFRIFRLLRIFRVADFGLTFTEESPPPKICRAQNARGPHAHTTPLQRQLQKQRPVSNISFISTVASSQFQTAAQRPPARKKRGQKVKDRGSTRQREGKFKVAFRIFRLFRLLRAASFTLKLPEESRPAKICTAYNARRTTRKTKCTINFQSHVLF